MAADIQFYRTFEDIVTLWKSTLTEIENAIPHVKGTVPYINEDTTKYDNSMKGVFHYCSNLKYIPIDIFRNQRNVLDFSFALEGCKSLVLDTDLTSEIFKGCTKAKSFARTFYGCNGEISYDIFKDCINATVFSMCFARGTWKSSQQTRGCFYHIFRNTKGRLFNSCFAHSTIDYMTEVFTGLKTAYDLSYCFFDSTIVYNIAEATHMSGMSNCDWSDMFRGCTSISNMGSCFENVKIKKNIIKDLITDEYYQYILDLHDCYDLALKITAYSLKCYFNVDGNKKAFSVIKFADLTLGNLREEDSILTFNMACIYPAKNTKAESSEATPVVYAKEGTEWYQMLSDKAADWGFILKPLTAGA